MLSEDISDKESNIAIHNFAGDMVDMADKTNSESVLPDAPVSQGIVLMDALNWSFVMFNYE